MFSAINYPSVQTAKAKGRPTTEKHMHNQLLPEFLEYDAGVGVLG